MKEEFREWLIHEGYSLKTPSGKPSTVDDYIKSIEKVCKLENCSIERLASNIQPIVKQYDTRGEKEDIGNESHKAVINALKRFQEFVTDTKNKKNPVS